MAEPAIIATFNVEGTRESYKNFIENLRRLLTEGHSHNVPVLAPRQNPIRFFDIMLQTETHALRVRFRRDDLYGVGYLMGNQWWEYGIAAEHPPQLIPNSRFLGIGFTYRTTILRDLQLGQQPLITAVSQLSTSADQDVRERALTVVMQMISESIRFTSISNILVTNFRGGFTLQGWMIDLEHGWRDLSGALLREDANPANFFNLSGNKMKIETAIQAVAVLGILIKVVCVNGGAAARFPQMLADVMDDGQCSTKGRPLVEIFSVRILNIDGEDPGDLYGTITVTDGLNSENIFNRSRENIQSIKPREFALLTGPTRSMSAYGSFTIDMDLMDRDRDASPDDEVSKGQISWDAANLTNVYDDTIYHDVSGQYGSAQVAYIVLSDAVQANVEITLINGDKENPADVYGLLAARNSNFMNESVLFQKTSGEYIDVRPGNLIPLSRSVVAVPLNSSLIVRADLWDYDTIGANDEIARGTVDFPAYLSGTFEKPIYGKYGEIRVKVTWT